MYSNGKKTDLSYPTTLGAYLRKKCKANIIDVDEDDFIKVFKVKVYSENYQSRIITIEVVTNKNKKTEIGVKGSFKDQLEN